MYTFARHFGPQSVLFRMIYQMGGCDVIFGSADENRSLEKKSLLCLRLKIVGFEMS